MPDKKKKRKIRKGLKVLLISLGALLVLLIAAAEITSSSKFCSTCHYMKPFYRSWQESSHKHIACSTCHYPPGLRSKIRAKLEGLVMVGRYWTKLYLKSKPWAEISDANCLKPGCHAKRLLQGQVRFNKVVFDHKVHLTDLRRGKTLRCTSCHSQIVQGKHITVTETTCFICHFKESKVHPRAADCRLCHKKDALVAEKTSPFDHRLVFDNGFSCDKCHSHTIVGDGAVPRENCYKCHFEQARLEKYGDTDLMHSTHITAHKIECDQCHLEIQHKIVKDIETIADCQTCHTNTHQAQKILFTGEGGRGLARPRPNVMWEKGLSCKACHMFHEEKGGALLKSETFIARDRACESCHGPGFVRLMKNWEASAGEKVAHIREVYVRAQREIQQSPQARDPQVLSLLEEAAFNIDVVDRGKSVHNIAYSQELLSSAFARIKEALKAVGSGYSPVSASFQPARIPTLCANCHTGIEDVRKDIWGLSFPHRPHLLDRNLSCDQCHSNIRRHGELIASKAGCTACHHQDTKRNCTDCHLLQKTLSEGGQLDGLTVLRDSMSEAGVACTDCHLDSQHKIFRSDAGKCVECHEEGYRQTFSQNKQEIAALLQSLEEAIALGKKLSLSAEEKASLAAAERLLRLIKEDGSRGAHNVSAIKSVLTTFTEKVKSLGQKMKS
jgi:nitrate/TMAO reductase-like tetraheme cytochrome c subunit